MQFAKRHEIVHVFSYQDHFSGQRRFLVSSYDEFWRRFALFMCSSVLSYTSQVSEVFYY